MRGWSHGHSLGAGLLLGFALQPHTLWLVSAAFLAGLYAGKAFELGRHLVSLLGERLRTPRPTGRRTLLGRRTW